MFVESYYLSLSFFQVLQSTVLKNEKKKNSAQKRCKSPKNFTGKTEEKRWKKRKENEK